MAANFPSTAGSGRRLADLELAIKHIDWVTKPTICNAQIPLTNFGPLSLSANLPVATRSADTYRCISKYLISPCASLPDLTHSIPYAPVIGFALCHSNGSG